MKSKRCRICKRKIGKTRKFLCYICFAKQQIKKDELRHNLAVKKAQKERELKRMWDNLTAHDQQEILFARAKEILKGGRKNEKNK